MAVVPGPVRRTVRSRARVVAVALLALVSLAAAGINATAAERLQATLDENWRGAYDILVTAGGGELAGLLAPNSMAASRVGLTLDEVAAIREVAGVDVAAPIGEVIIPMLSTPQAQFTLPKGHVGANEVPQAFRVTISYLTDDGLGERLVSTETIDIVVDESVRPIPEPRDCNINGYDATPEEYPILTRMCGGHVGVEPITYPTGGGWGSNGTVEGDTWLFTLGNGIMSTTRVTLVDPAAERELLGEAGEFLIPLESLAIEGLAHPDVLLAWAEETDSRHGDDFLRMRAASQDAQFGMSAEELDEWKRLYEANGAVYEEPKFNELPYVPMLGRDTAPAPLTMRIDVEGFGDAPRYTQELGTFPYDLPAAQSSGGAGVDLGTTTVDASTMLNPFSTQLVFVPWPGTSADGLVGPPWALGLSIFITGSVEPAPTEVLSETADGVEVRIAAGEFIAPFFNPSGPGGNALPLTDSEKLGSESVFASNPTASYGETSAQGAMVGSFTVDGIASLQSTLGHVPLGAYESVGSTLIPGSSPVATSAIELRPSVSGLGLVSPETVAIASLESAAQWGDLAPVNAVRVRVADVGGFGADAITTIANVAAAIEKLGFTATVVAGSSPTEVTVHVDGYAFGVTDADEQQTVGPLGAVTQRWSELGAASRVDLAVSTSSFGVLAVALGAAALLLAAVQLAGVPGRRQQASVMRTIGWRRGRIVRWMAAEELVSLVIVAIAGAGALLLANSPRTVGVAVGASVAALVVTSVLAVMLGARPVGSGIRSLSRGKRRHRMAEVTAWVVTPTRFALRQLTVHRINVIVQLLATLVTAVAAAAMTVTILEGRDAAGASALGVFAVGEALIAQLALGAVALVAGVVLAVIARRIDLGRRREQWTTMRSMGWSAGQVRSVQLIEGLIVGVPAIALACAAAFGYLHYTESALRLPLIAAGSVAVGLTVVLVLTSWREKR